MIIKLVLTITCMYYNRRQTARLAIKQNQQPPCRATMVQFSTKHEVKPNKTTGLEWVSQATIIIIYYYMLHITHYNI